MAFGAPEPNVEIGIDESRRRILVWITGRAHGPLVALCISELFRRHRELVAYDMLYDLTRYSGDVLADDIDPIVEAYAGCGPDAAVPCRTAFVTYDRLFQQWATAMDQQFPGREHRAFPRLPPALEFLACPACDRRRAPSLNPVILGRSAAETRGLS